MATASRLTAIALATLISGAALAQSPTPTQGVPVSPNAPAESGISMEQARRIATDNGMVRIEEIELDDGKWEIEGRDAAGAEIEIDLRATDGTVVKMERDRPAAASARP